MKKAILFIVPLLLTVKILGQVDTLDQEKTSFWELKLDKEGIQVHTRWKMATHGELAREIRGTFTTKASKYEVLDILRAKEAPLQYMDKAKEGYNFDFNADQSQWRMYVEFNYPWPFRNQDLVTDNCLSPAGDNMVIITIISNPELLPQKNNLKRMDGFDGRWILSDEKDGTRVEYAAFSNEKPKFPRWITDPIIQSTTFRTMENLLRIVERAD